MLFLALACATEPDPCTPMCESAAELYGGCLQSWGADWTAAAYEDEDDFLDACATWAWEMRQLEGEEHEGATDETCAERAASFTAEEATCDDFTELDWSAPPWSDASGASEEAE